MNPPANPSHALVGLTLDDGWRVLRRVDRQPGSTGGFFSQRYVVQSKTGATAFLKALDYAEALRNSDDPARILQALTAAFNYERDLLSRCKDYSLDRVVTILADGKVKVSDTDARSQMDLGDRFDIALRLRALHHIATGLKQLHGLSIAHQDLKPSNVLTFKDGAKVGDLGCASRKDMANPRDHLPVVGDRTYAPPELLYHHIPPDWNARRFACDVYLLGSMVSYFFTTLGITHLWVPELLSMHRPGVWTGTFVEVLPFVRDAFSKAVDKVTAEVRGRELKGEISVLVRELCDPDPAKRGHPKNRIGVSGNQYSVERYVTKFDLLARRASLGVLRD